MYYQTTIRSVGIGDAIDTQGKRLKFIGYLPCQAGDAVWTDGKIIFGHVSRKTPSPLILDSKGIPTIGEGELRGYINKSGNLREYAIVEDDWITNDDKKFYHGAEKYEDNYIIDAEVSEDGDLYFATDGVYRKNKSVTYNNHLFIAGYFKTSGHLDDQISEVTPLNLVHAVYIAPTPYVGDEIKLGVDDPNENKDITFYKNDQIINSVNLKQYADLAEDLALQIKNQIMAESLKEENAVNWAQQPSPPESFIASSYARVVTLNIQKNGDWDAVITTSAYGYCFPYYTFDGSIFAGSFPSGEDKIADKDLVECYQNFENVVFGGYAFMPSRLPFNPHITRYPEYAGDKIDDETGEYTQGYKNHAKNAIAYYIPLARFRHYIWFPMLFSSCIVLKIHNGEIETTIYSEAGGGSVIESNGIVTEWNEKGRIYNSWSIFRKRITNDKEKKWEFPLVDDWHFKADGLQIKSIFNSNITIEVSQDINALLHSNSIYYEAYLKYPLLTYTAKDQTAIELAKTYTDTNNPEVFHGFYFPKVRLFYHIVSAEDAWNEYNFAPKKDSNKFLSGWFRQDDEKYTGDEIRLNHCFSKLSGDKYIIGVKDGKLIKVDGNNIEVLGDGLKNFRLREMKNIAKTKR